MATENTRRLTEVGPADPVHGFPLWYEDGDGTRLELGLGPDPMLPAIDDPVASTPVPGQSFPAEFPGEAFYFLAESRMPIGGAGQVGQARLILGLEAAFGTPAPDPRARVVFARVRVRIDDVVPGASYTITHPYGVTDPLEADDRGRVFVTDDRGIADNAFDAVRRSGLVAPFLRWAGTPPDGYLGDGVSPRPVTGSPFGTNFFRVEGPDVADVAGVLVDPDDPTNPNRIRSSLFSVQGKRATRAGAAITSAGYTRTGGTVVIDIHARSAPDQVLEVSGPGVSRTEMQTGDRSYTARAAATAVPPEVTVVNTTDTPASSTTAPVGDLITASAIHSPADGTLTITASSSDDAAPELTATGFGPLTGAQTVFTAVAATPAQIEITSAAGGRALAPVVLTGPAQPGLPVIADAGPDRSIVFGDELVLDGSGSRSGITSYAWSQVAGPPAVISTPAQARTTVAATEPGDYRFALEVNGPAGGATAEVGVTVEVAVPDEVTVQRAQFRTDRDEYRLSGSQTGARPAVITAHLNGAEIGTSRVDALGAWEVRRRLTPADNALQPGVGATVQIISSRGGSITAPLQIRT